MRCLIACESSGLVRDAFIALGHEAMSCDLKPTERPGPHYMGDVRDVLYEPWDLLIAHPVCRYMANSGARWLYEPGTRIRIEERWEAMRKGAEFFNLLANVRHIPKRATENPVMHGHALALVGGSATQYVQPHHLGSPFKKLTGLWLHGLPKLKRTHWPKDYPAGTEFKQAVWLMGPSPTREEDRSRTDPCIAAAMARTWGARQEVANQQFHLEAA